MIIWQYANKITLKDTVGGAYFYNSYKQAIAIYKFGG